MSGFEMNTGVQGQCPVTFENGGLKWLSQLCASNQSEEAKKYIRPRGNAGQARGSCGKRESGSRV